MSIRAKFDGGKFYNRVNRGSWHARCYGGGLRKNFGPKWSPTVWEKVTGTKAGCTKSRPEYKARAYQRKIKSAAVSAKSKSTLEYGKDALECIPDVSSDTLQADIQEYLGKHINVDEAVLTALETQTKEQSHSGVWHEEGTKFLNRRISHKWIIDEASGTSEWYAGTVTSIVSGVDGAPDTIYDVQYDNESEAFEVDHLQEDLSTGS
ncbi:unnamed protein product [Mytilus edulis]|uniref:Uncharacterized protein n=1 Tax=Mytilus edulis TaxID=6550 RepID=A0A8S3R2Y3_MYTED|nr:unnamed protein product [Mytilus edulis]